jgi:hypothetical protein
MFTLDVFHRALRQYERIILHFGCRYVLYDPVAPGINKSFRKFHICHRHILDILRQDTKGSMSCRKLRYRLFRAEGLISRGSKLSGSGLFFLPWPELALSCRPLAPTVTSIYIHSLPSASCCPCIPDLSPNSPLSAHCSSLRQRGREKLQRKLGEMKNISSFS